jgi:Trk-type K+ transport system membrane component
VVCTTSDTFSLVVMTDSKTPVTIQHLKKKLTTTVSDVGNNGDDVQVELHVEDMFALTTTTQYVHTPNFPPAVINSEIELRDQRQPQQKQQQLHEANMNQPIEKHLTNDVLIDDELGSADTYNTLTDQYKLNLHLGDGLFFLFIKNWLRGRGEFYWKQRFLFIFHIIYIIGIGLLYSFIVYGLEHKHSGWDYMDSLYMSFSAFCQSGFVVQPIDNIYFGTQFIFFIAMITGSVTFTAMPPLLIKIYRARKRMFARRAEHLEHIKKMIAMAKKDKRKELKKEVSTKSVLVAIAEKGQLEQISTNTSNQTNVEQSQQIELEQEIQQERQAENIIGTSSAQSSMQRRSSIDSVNSADVLIPKYTQMMTQPPVDPVRNYVEATHLDPNSFASLPDEVKNYFSSSSFNITAYSNPASWPSHVKDYFTNNMNREYFGSIPYTDIEYVALVWLLILILSIVIFTNLIGFIIMGLELSQIKYVLEGFNPWWVSAFTTISSFHNVGFSIFTDSMNRFVYNRTINLVVCFLIIIGNTGFPIVLRLTIFICYKWSRQYRLVFKYMLEKHHHLSLHLYPGLQTRAYALISVLLLLIGICTPLIMDHNHVPYLGQTFGTKLLMAFFQACNARTGGFQTIGFTYISIATLCIYIVMMRVKPQMACGLRENAYKIVDVIRKFGDKELKDSKEKHSGPIYSSQIEEAISKLPEDIFQRNENGDMVIVVKKIREDEDDHVPTEAEVFSQAERTKNFLVRLTKHLLLQSRNLFGKNNVWLAIIIIIIAFSESSTALVNPNVNMFSIVFEVVSAFGNVGLSIGMPNSPLAFSAALNKFSKFMIIIAMITGRHRGYYSSMVDQQEDQYDTQLTNKSLMKQRMRIVASNKRKKMV